MSRAPADPPQSTAPGRLCPVHYRYRPAALATAPDIEADTLYVAGGLYGNQFALDVLESLAAAERGRVALAFNGDFNWFNVSPAGFESLNRRVLAHHASRGNVETELAADPSPGGMDAGCGCAYPDEVSDADVARSNAMLARLRDTARGAQDLRTRLGTLPMFLAARVGGLRVGIVHGDAQSLAGWDFAHDRLAESQVQARIGAWFGQARVGLFASSHTCLPALREVRNSGDGGWVINNGAAGMPNFAGTRYGLVTRVSLAPASGAAAAARLYGTRIDGVHVDALRLDYDHAAWMRRFLADWPAGSDAHVSYWHRICEGPSFRPEQALASHAADVAA